VLLPRFFPTAPAAATGHPASSLFAMDHAGLGSSGPLYRFLWFGPVEGDPWEIFVDRKLEEIGHMHMKGSRVGTRNPSAIPHIPRSSALRRRRCCSLETSLQHSSPSRQSVSVERPSSSRIQTTTPKSSSAQRKIGRGFARFPTPILGSAIELSPISACHRPSLLVLLLVYTVSSTRGSKCLLFLLPQEGFLTRRCGCAYRVDGCRAQDFELAQLEYPGTDNFQRDYPFKSAIQSYHCWHSQVVSYVPFRYS